MAGEKAASLAEKSVDTKVMMMDCLLAASWAEMMAHVMAHVMATLLDL